ncbi:hypothetical protein MNBD_GAMMA21-1806 [hydrothermal vent metagenome]|uniref:Inner membrane protein YgaP-like transmembrane domain-containing protein n=1 Tax=hydrothermal vent metagenome TaxID=652676 RepID=A0A3B0ZTR7_9ZZZZ
MKLVRNVNLVDKILRLGIGAGSIYVGFIETTIIDHAVINVLVGVFGVFNIVAALIGFCPVYYIAGINTCTSEDDC